MMCYYLNVHFQGQRVNFDMAHTCQYLLLLLWPSSQWVVLLMYCTVLYCTGTVQTDGSSVRIVTCSFERLLLGYKIAGINS